MCPSDVLLWQVAVSRTQPGSRVIGVDVIPAQPPKGVSTIQGNFLAPEVQEYVREFLKDPWRGRPLPDGSRLSILDSVQDTTDSPDADADAGAASNDTSRTVDVVLSDMSAPWAQTTGFWKRSLSDPYYRMMNTSGTSFRDHIGSMVSRISSITFPTHVAWDNKKRVRTSAVQRSPLFKPP